MYRWPRIVFGVLALVAVWTMVILRPPSAAPAARAHPGGDDKLASLAHQLEYLQQRTAQLEREASVQRAVAHEAPTATPTVDDKPAAPSLAVAPDSPEQAREKERSAFAEYFGGLDAARERERVDERWQSELETQLWPLFQAGSVPDSSLKAVHCGATLCRIEVVHQSAQSQRTFPRELTRVVRGMTSIQWLDGESVVYVARDGASLPDWPGHS